MANQKNFFFDTSIVSPITFRKMGTSLTETINTWEQFLDEMDYYHTNFADTAFKWLRRPALYLEIIGLGDIREELKTQVSPTEWANYSAFDPEEGAIIFYNQIEKRIRDYIYKKIPAKNLYRETTVNFLREYTHHLQAHWLVSKIKQWAKNLRHPDHYQAFAEAIIWDTLTRYPYINLKSIAKKDRLSAMKLWAGIAGLITKKYLEHRADGFEYSALGLFAEIHKTVDCFNSTNPDEKKYDTLIRTWDDMADADSINFALLGYNQQPVHVVTMEKTDELKRRLQCLAENLKGLSPYGFTPIFLPGTITNFSQSIKIIDFFEVQDFL